MIYLEFEIFDFGFQKQIFFAVLKMTNNKLLITKVIIAKKGFMSTEKPKNKLFSKIKGFWLKYEQKIMLTLGLILVAVISFQFGALKGQKWQKAALIIEKPAQCENTPVVTQDTQKTQNLTPEAPSNTIKEDSTKNPKDCVFVGSKNSDKYYPPSCSFAKRLKPENVVCFKDEQEAESKGYKKSTACFK